MSYQIFSHFYDKVMDQTTYQDWLAFIERYQPTKKETLSIMELACGTGIIAVELAKKGHQVTGVDLSDDMLALAYERMVEERVSLQLVEADMRELEELGSFDLVTCFSDSLCYLPEEEDLALVFKGVYDNLAVGGTFLFDVHSLYQMNEVFPGYQYIYQDEEDVFLWESYALEVENAVEHVLTFFVQEEDGRFQRMQEIHEERSYPLETYQALLKAAGFAQVEVKADFGQNELEATTTRWFFVCEK